MNTESRKEKPDLMEYQKVYNALVDGNIEDYSKLTGILIFHDHIMNVSNSDLGDSFPGVDTLVNEAQHKMAHDIQVGNLDELIPFGVRNPSIFEEYIDVIIIKAFNKTLNNFTPVHKYLTTANLPICSQARLENILADQLEEFGIPVDRIRLTNSVSDNCPMY